MTVAKATATKTVTIDVAVKSGDIKPRGNLIQLLPAAAGSVSLRSPSGKSHDLAVDAGGKGGFDLPDPIETGVWKLSISGTKTTSVTINGRKLEMPPKPPATAEPKPVSAGGRFALPSSSIRNGQNAISATGATGDAVLYRPSGERHTAVKLEGGAGPFSVDTAAEAGIWRLEVPGASAVVVNGAELAAWDDAAAGSKKQTFVFSSGGLHGTNQIAISTETKAILVSPSGEEYPVEPKEGGDEVELPEPIEQGDWKLVIDVSHRLVINRQEVESPEGPTEPTEPTEPPEGETPPPEAGTKPLPKPTPS